VVEIGSTLREARERQGLERADVERATRIRQRYLLALEDERFELLPGLAYAKGFLRVYADFLGLEEQPLVAEFNARFPEAEQPEVAQPRSRPRRARTWLAPPAPRLAVPATILVAVLLGLLAWHPGGARHPAPAQRQSPAKSRPNRPAPVVQHRVHNAAPTAGHLVLHARGPCWLFVRVGSPVGPVLYEATLQPGETLRYTLAARRPQLWIRIGAPPNLALSLNGRPLAAFTGGPRNIFTTRNGVRPA
jgi:transcriptional regulator with XRE-family HTH domain